MGVALLGKCIGFLALVLFLYTCYAFRIRDHTTGQMAFASSAEQPHRAACASASGRCQEKRIAGTLTKRHDTTSQTHASSIARKPPAELVSSLDEGRGLEGGGVKHEKTGFAKDGGASRSVEEEEEEEEEDEEEAIVEVETVEEIASSDDDDDDDDEKEGEDDGEDYDGSREEEKDAEDSRGRVMKGRRKIVEDEEENGKMDLKKKVSPEKGLKEIIRSKKLGKEDEDDEEEEEDEDQDEDEEEEEEEDEEEDEDEEESEEVVATPPPKKLEKVRYADKDKIKSVEITYDEKSKVDNVIKAKANEIKQAKLERKPEEIARSKIETTKPDEKKLVEGLSKPVQATKKIEPVKITKSESESSKLKMKPVERAKIPVKPEASKTREPSKKETTSPQPARIKRSDKDEMKVKTKTHVDAAFALARLNDAILRVPTFVPNFTAIENLECQQHIKIFLRQLRGHKLWALQMLDSSAKIPSGLLRGNINQFGDFDECLGVMAHVKLDENTIKVQGKYCLAYIDLSPSRPDMKLPVNMMQARAAIRASMHDSGYFIPRFQTVKWALCLPAACTAEDAQSIVEQALNDYNSTVGIQFIVDVDPKMCYVKQKSRSYSKETICVLYFYAMVVCLAIVATVRDYLVVSEGKGNYSERIIMSFSLRRTVRSLFKKESGKGGIPCIHGIRSLITIMLYISHQVITISMLPFSNRIEFTEVTNNPLTTILRGGLLYTDTFLLLSGTLTSFNMAHEFITRGEIRWFCRFIARYIRLTPMLLVVVFWYAFIMEHTGSGPQWNDIILGNADLCKSSAWMNLLYIQNFLPFEEECATHTHHLALDVQLSLLAPMLVFFLQCKPIIGILVIFFFILLSATLRYITTMSNYLSIVVFHGMSLKHIYKTVNLVYIVPIYRITPYLFGVTLGVLLRYTGPEVRIPKVLVILGWLIAMALASWSLGSPWQLARRDYVYDVVEATNYIVISPVVSALALSWIVFACYTNHGGIINRFLSHHWLIIFSRISYAVYLTQFIVFFYNVGTARYSNEFHFYRFFDPLEAGATISISIVLTLLFDLPMQEIKNVLMESTDILKVAVPCEEGSTRKLEKAARRTDEAKARERKAFEEDEVASTGWDWQRDIVDGGSRRYRDGENVEDEEQVHMPILKASIGRRRSFISREPTEAEASEILARDWAKNANKRWSRDSDEYREQGKRERSVQRDYREQGNDAASGSSFSRMQQEREEAVKRGRRSLSRSFDAKRLSTRGSEEEEEEEEEAEEEEEEEEEEEDRRRYRRSRSRGRSVITESDDYRSWELVGKERSSSRGPESKRLSRKSEEREAPLQRQTRPPLSRYGEAKRARSSEDEVSSQQRKIEKRHPPVEPRISDEEDWESELRIRRKQFMEKHAIRERDPRFEDEEDLSSPRRRSSAEGKIALLKDPGSDDNMDSWTVSVGTRAAPLLGSSQERSEEEEEEDVAYRRREYRERAPPPREEVKGEGEEEERRPSYASSSEVTSMEEDSDVASYNFVLTKDSRKKSLQDLSKLARDDDSDLTESGWNVVRQDSGEGLPRSSSTGLYKRESIVKSQASEEDPEYLVVERPKLVQQEREHPFKKAWQMQKSRSEEDGSAYTIKEPKEQSKAETARSRDEDPPSKEVGKEGGGGEQRYGESIDASPDDDTELTHSRSSDTEEYTTRSSRSEGAESSSTERSKSFESNKFGLRSSDVEEDSSRSNWPSEDEQVYKTSPRSKLEETEWIWEREET